MKLTAPKLREILHRVLDQVLATGEPVEIEHKGRRLRIVALEQPSRLSLLVRRTDIVIGDSSDFIHLDWSSEWRG